MDHIRYRSELISLVAKKTVVPAVRRACTLGAVEVYGCFSAVTPSGKPGWILKVTTQHGGSYLVAVVPDEIRHDVNVLVLSKVPWQTWVGHANPDPLMSGDHPETYYTNRLHARGEHTLDEIDI